MADFDSTSPDPDKPTQANREPADAQQTIVAGGLTADAQAWNELVRATRGWWTVVGIVLVVLGVLAILAPWVMGTAFVFVLGWLLVLGGAVQVLHAFGVKGWGGATWQIVLGLIYFVAGVLILVNSQAALVALALVIAIFLLLNGIARIVFSVQVKPTRGWGWMMAGGIAAVILAILILLNWPGDAFWIVGLLVGIDLLFAGASLLGLASASSGLGFRDSATSGDSV